MSKSPFVLCPTTARVSTVHDSTGKSPGDIFLGRKLATSFEILTLTAEQLFEYNKMNMEGLTKLEICSQNHRIAKYGRIPVMNVDQAGHLDVIDGGSSQNRINVTHPVSSKERRSIVGVTEIKILNIVIGPRITDIEVDITHYDGGCRGKNSAMFRYFQGSVIILVLIISFLYRQIGEG